MHNLKSKAQRWRWKYDLWLQSIPFHTQPYRQSVCAPVSMQMFFHLHETKFSKRTLIFYHSLLKYTETCRCSSTAPDTWSTKNWTFTGLFVLAFACTAVVLLYYTLDWTGYSCYCVHPPSPCGSAPLLFRAIEAVIAQSHFALHCVHNLTLPRHLLTVPFYSLRNYV